MVATARTLCRGFLSPGKGPRHTIRAVATHSENTSARGCLPFHSRPVSSAERIEALPSSRRTSTLSFAVRLTAHPSAPLLCALRLAPRHKSPHPGVAHTSRRLRCVRPVVSSHASREPMPAPAMRNQYTEHFAIARDPKTLATKIDATDDLSSSPPQLTGANPRETPKSNVPIGRRPDSGVNR